MISFTSVPYDDIIVLLTAYDKSISNEKIENYKNAWNLLINNNVSQVPVSIADFMIASNLIRNKMKSYDILEIIGKSENDLKDLSIQLNLPSSDKERIIGVLGYLGVLNNSIFASLPAELLRIVMKNLDCKDIKLFCELSTEFQNFCDKGNYELVLREKLQTRMDIKNYNSKQLEQLCLTRFPKHLYGGLLATFIINDSGQVFAFGDNRDGILGLVDHDIIVKPSMISNIPKIVSIGTKGLHTLLLTEEGTVYGFGFNDKGQLGLGDFDDRNLPVVLPNMNNIISVACGFDFSLILDDKGQVYSFGSNDRGRLGHDDLINRNVPTPISKLNNIVGISCGGDFSLLLNDQGNVYSFGRNFRLQLGYDSSNQSVKSPTIIPTLKNIIQIASGLSHSLGLDNNGHVYSFGNESNGRLGLGNNTKDTLPTRIPNLNNIIQVSCGEDFSLALNENGNVFLFGLNREIGSIFPQYYFDPTPLLNINNIVEISAGDNHALLLDNNGNIHVFGNNDKGQLGLGYKSSDEARVTIIPDFNVHS